MSWQITNTQRDPMELTLDGAPAITATKNLRQSLIIWVYLHRQRIILKSFPLVYSGFLVFSGLLPVL